MTKLLDHLELTHVTEGGNKGFWLYDRKAGYNVVMKAPTEIDAYIHAINSYSETQARLLKESNESHRLLDRIRGLLDEADDEGEW